MRRRGRPAGARTRVLAPRPVLGAHHFAFLRATFQGLDARSAWRRYLAFSETESLDLRRLEQTRRAMLSELVRLADAAGQGLPPDHPIHRACALLRTDAVAGAVPVDPIHPATAAARPAARALPSLDEFIAASGLDPDSFGEGEWLALYREHHGLDAPGNSPRPATALEPQRAAAPDRRTVAERVRALGLLEQMVGRTAQPQDALDLWLAPPTAARLQAVGWRCLADLDQVVRSAGRAWWRRVPGLGSVRAQAIERWLADLHRAWRQPPVPGSVDAHQRARRRWLGTAAVRSNAGQPTPWPSVYMDERSLAASSTATSPGIDLDAKRRIVTWLETHRSSASTWRAYRKEAERLWWWCSSVHRCRLSTLTPSDLAAYAAFLAQPPAEWVCSTPLPRSDPDWRPLRGPLQPRSIAVALRIIHSLLDSSRAQLSPAEANQPGLTAAVPSPRTARTPRPAAPCPALPAGTFTGAAARRWAVLLALVQEVGCTPAEALSLRLPSSTGRGGPPDQLVWPDGRTVCIGPSLGELITRHHQDACSRARDQPQADAGWPVLLSLREGVRRWLVRGDDVALAPWPDRPQARAWSWAACRLSLKRAQQAATA